MMRSIPARAGEPRSLIVSNVTISVYPRACGGTASRCGSLPPPAGLSPRVRGNPVLDRLEQSFLRSIPARAGEPRVVGIRRRLAGVYPRACGGTPSSAVILARAAGLSPRVRGNPQPHQHVGLAGGSIPARAGEPDHGIDLLHPHEVYPRACGGTYLNGEAMTYGGGLSPRVRGNHTNRPSNSRRPGSIPARAGEPLGSLLLLRGRGSIPARAGEPMMSVLHQVKAAVYPRACGGTLPVHPVQAVEHGLSPRVRGNLSQSSSSGLIEWSIPARAGEPAQAGATSPGRRVYPRACGGTSTATRWRRCAIGLSPRVRGNQLTG